MVLETEPGIWVPAVVFGFVIGIFLLAYSAEKTDGSLSRLWKRIRRKRAAEAAAQAVDNAVVAPQGMEFVGDGSATVSKLNSVDAYDDDDEPPPNKPSPRWVRGCSCLVRF